MEAQYCTDFTLWNRQQQIQIIIENQPISSRGQLKSAVRAGITSKLLAGSINRIGNSYYRIKSLLITIRILSFVLFDLKTFKFCMNILKQCIQLFYNLPLTFSRTLKDIILYKCRINYILFNCHHVNGFYV